MVQDSVSTSGGAGRTAVVTGGGSGIGRAIAVALAERGMDVLVVGRRADALAATAARHSGIRRYVADVTEPASAGGVVEAAAARFGRVDVLVNNAGSGTPGPLAGFDVAAARSMWATNVLGPSLLAQAALPHLVRSRGAITESDALDRMGLTRAEIEAVKADERNRIPLGRRGEPEDVAPWAVALADPASWVTGQVIGVDGGYLLV